MKGSFYRSMLWLHGWVGLALGWASFLIFLTGSIAYFNPEITQWMRPQLVRAPSTEHALAVALKRLRVVAPASDEWTIRLPVERDPSLAIYWSVDGSAERVGELLDGVTGEQVHAPNTLGGRFFYSFHFTFLLPGWGYWIAGAAAMFMLLAVISGVVAHRKILQDFFTFRPRHSAQRAWLDLHNLTSVLALPFYVAIAYTGLVTLMYSYMPTMLRAAYGESGFLYFREAFRAREDAPERDLPAREFLLADLNAQVGKIAQDGAMLTDLKIENPSTMGAAATGYVRNVRAAQLETTGMNASAVADIHDLLYELHLAHFADWTVRWLLFASGLAGTAMIGTGLIVWTGKRTRATGLRGAGTALVERINVFVVTGSMAAVGAFFWANRLLPIGLEDRAHWEVRCFFGCWAAMGVHALLRRRARLWREQLWTVAAVFGALPLISGAGSGRYLWHSLTTSDLVFASFDAAFLVTAALASTAGWHLLRRDQRTLASADAKASTGAVPAETQAYGGPNALDRGELIA